ncbi:LuxR C-terminal-related transcriptional regulator [Methylorubrum extorquens]|uniref:LuxR C-terminal-related transcriptional regulator n=1 Tax=Methylorubrum extorquens TaxID=408 RepID=UPI002238A539|nr:LuxR C-terminal-related transcriptional regulator [Methylorubrum extorquens]UYW26336.1 LuxR C-terminal-related transcriptional regulator [Methylorubrum extorquens]UYW33924.1 LuxR C-terminal-related transcriptional regulator [Methylorubrum extorquens]
MNSSEMGPDAKSGRSPDVSAAKRIAAIPTMLEIVCRSTGLGFAAVAQVTDATWLACRVRDDAGFGLQADTVLRADAMPCREVRRHRQPVVIDDVGPDTAVLGLSSSGSFGFRSYISFPITMPDGEIFGTLCAIGKEPAALDRPEITGLFQQFSELIGLLLDAQRQPPVARPQLEEVGFASWERNEPLRALIEHLPVGAGLFGSDGQALVANAILQPLLSQGRVPGADPDAAPHWTGYAGDGTVLDPRDHPFARALRGDRVPRTRFYHRGDDGTGRWTRISGVPLPGTTDNARTQNGKEPAVLLFVEEEREMEGARRASDERFQRFAEHSTNVLWLADLESRRLTYLNHALRRVWGVAPERLPSLESWLETIHSDDRDSVERTLERVWDGEAVVQEYRILRPSDGAVRRIRETVFPIAREDGRVRQLGGIAEDVAGHTGARIYLVDEDAPARRALLGLLQRAGYEVQVFAKAAALAEVASALQPGCVILDIETAGPESLTVAKALRAGRLALPVLVIGRSQGDVGFGVRAMKAGAVDYLEKPCEPAVLLTAVSTALAELRTDTERSHAHDDAKLRIAALSPREREVLEGLLAGGTNKSIGRALGLSPRTVEIHRARVMEALGARTLPEAVLTAARAGVQPTESQ